MSLRRGLYVANRALLSHNLTKSVAPLGAIRFYATTQAGRSQPQQAGSQFQETTIEQSSPQGKISENQFQGATTVDRTELEKGDLIAYQVANRKTEGLVLDIFNKPFTDEYKTNHKASAASPIVKIQNYYTKQYSYHRADSLEFLARVHEFESTAGQPKAGSSQPSQASQPGQSRVDEAQSALYKQQQRLAQSAEKIEQELKSDQSPIHTDFAPGDIVRFRLGRNFTAGVILEIVYKPVHDEAGAFHGATKENPMARLENIWTKKIQYHHLSVLERVKRAGDIEKEHGRFADSEFGVYNNKGTARS